MVVTSYEIVIADVKFLQRYHWKYIVVDEGHRLKNFNCKLLRELRTIPTANKLLLTGALVCTATWGCLRRMLSSRQTLWMRSRDCLCITVVHLRQLWLPARLSWNVRCSDYHCL